MDKAQAGVSAFNEFFSQFGPPDDVYTRVLIEILLEELFSADSSKIGDEHGEK